MAEPDTGRVAQRRRTRKAIVEAAARLLREGADPSVADIDAAADVSRRTIYMYFPRLDQLIIDATLGEMAQAGYGARLDFDRYGDDVHARVEALIRTLLDMSEEALPLGRRLLSLTVDAPADADPARADPADAGRAGPPRRGYRRVEWIELAVQPLRARLSREQFGRLVSGLSVLIGWEAMIVLRDTRGLRRATERRVTTWSAHALIDAMLTEATP
ncbi:MAG: TetR/AcrR family transcriptional regulator [Jatrophihabitantaceae bacterium]